MSKQAMKLALVALESGVDGQTSIEMDEAITALREALAEQPAQTATYTCGVCGVPMQMEKPAQQQEPVAWGKPTDEMVQAATDEYDEWANENKGTTECIRAMLSKALKASPPTQRTWHGLMDEEIAEQDWRLSADRTYEEWTLQEQLVVCGVKDFARAIEAKLKEKNT